MAVGSSSLGYVAPIPASCIMGVVLLPPLFIPIVGWSSILDMPSCRFFQSICLRGVLFSPAAEPPCWKP